MFWGAVYDLAQLSRTSRSCVKYIHITSNISLFLFTDKGCFDDKSFTETIPAPGQKGNHNKNTLRGHRSDRCYGAVVRGIRTDVDR